MALTSGSKILVSDINTALSNKQDKYVKQIAEKILPEGIVSIALGQCEGCPTKPDPTAALTISRQLGFRATDTAMIGDGETDIMTAKNAGMLSVGCAWGYRGRDTLEKHGADHIIYFPEELLDIFN